MTKNELIARLRDSSAANRLTLSEVGHMIDLALDWGAVQVEDDPAPASAELEGAEAPAPEPQPAAAEEEVYDDSDDDDDDETNEVTAPRGHRPKARAKPATRRHR
jgi:hypothetical protein